MTSPTPSASESDGECVLSPSAHPLRGNQKDSRVCGHIWWKEERHSYNQRQKRKGKKEAEGKRTSDCLGSSKRQPDRDGRGQDSHAITGYTKRERNRSWSPVTRKCSSSPFSCSLSPNENDDGTCKKESEKDIQADRRHFRPRRRSPSINWITHQRAELSMQSHNNR